MRIGIDLGGTKIEAIGLSDTGKETVRQRVPTPRDYESSVDAIVELVREMERATGETGTVGVGIPGTIVPETGLVKNANSVWLNGRPLGKDLEQRLDRPVRLMNDANCFALSEATDGAAAGARVVFGVILGTGVGGGIVVDGKIIMGANLIAGEWGHNPLPWSHQDELPGPPCYCGKHGCVETWLSGPAYQRDQGDRYHDRLGRALASLVNVLDPDVIVLGGGLSNVEGLPEAAAAALARYVFAAGASGNPVLTRVVRAKHGDSSGVRGAAWLWPAANASTLNRNHA